MEKEFKEILVEWQGDLPIDTRTGKKKRIFFTDTDWCRVAWFKVKGVKNLSVYSFVPSGGQPGKGFRQTFSKANSENSLLRTNYIFAPFKRDM